MSGSREYSAGGVVVRVLGGQLEIAVIRPAGRNAMALPKGHIDPGETPVQAAAREVLEETGLTVELMRKLGEVSYTYRFQQRTISKVVEFFMFRWVAGEIDHITEAMRREVHVAWWVPLSEAATELSYPGERRMAARALSELPARPGPEDLGGT